MFLFLTLVFLIVPSLSFAQTDIQPLTDLQIFGTSTYDYRESVTDTKEIKGTPYLSDEYSEGKVLVNNTLYQDVLLRYNVYNDLFEARLGENSIVIDPVKNPIDTIYYEGHKFVRKFLQSTKNNRLSHVAVLYKHSNSSLYKRYRITLVQATRPGAYAEAKPAAFDPKQPEYYLGRGEELSLLKGVKAIADFFEVEAKEVKSFMRSGQLKLQHEEDLITLCNHLSNLYSNGN